MHTLETVQGLNYPNIEYIVVNKFYNEQVRNYLVHSQTFQIPLPSKVNNSTNKKKESYSCRTVHKTYNRVPSICFFKLISYITL